MKISADASLEIEHLRRLVPNSCRRERILAHPGDSPIELFRFLFGLLGEITSERPVPARVAQHLKSDLAKKNSVCCLLSLSRWEYSEFKPHLKSDHARRIVTAQPDAEQAGWRGRCVR